MSESATESIYNVSSETPEPPVSQDNVTDLNDAPEGGRPYLPQNRYVAVCTKAEFKRSKASDNPMIVFEWEVVAPKIIRFRNEDFTVEGTTITDFCSLQPQALGRLKTLHKALKLPMTINAAQPDTNQYLGKAASMLVSTKAEVMTVEGTNEPILDENNKPIANNNYRIGKIIAAAPEHNREIPF